MMYPIIFILIDALRTSNMGCYGYSLNTTPNIDRIAERAILFENAFSCINATDPSITSIFSGMLPVSHGLIKHGSRVSKADVYGLKSIMWLPELLQQAGYYTIALDWLGRWHTRGFEFYGPSELHKKYAKVVKTPVSEKCARLFVKHMRNKVPAGVYSLLKKVYRKTLKKPPVKSMIENAAELTEAALKLIKQEQGKPFFLFIHYWDVHWPYRGIDDVNDYKDSLSSKRESVKEIIKCYDDGVKYVDREVGRLLDFLDEKGLLEKALLIITSDHGESLGEHGIFWDHHGLYDCTIRVPLILHHRSLPRGERINSLVQHVDLVPTVLDFLNVKNDYHYDGYSLMPLIRGEVNKIRDFILIEEAHKQRKIGIRTLNSKYIRDVDLNATQKCKSCGIVHGSSIELYNLNDDPFEENNLAFVRQEVADYFDSLLLSERKKLKQRSIVRLKSQIKKLKQRSLV